MASSILSALPPPCCSCSGRPLAAAAAAPTARTPHALCRRQQQQRRSRCRPSPVPAAAASSSSPSSSSSYLRPSTQGIKRDASELFGDTPMVLEQGKSAKGFRRKREKGRDEIEGSTQRFVFSSFDLDLKTSPSPSPLSPTPRTHNPRPNLLRSSSTALPRAAARASPASWSPWSRARGK